MSFVKNPEIQQIKLNDSASMLTSREYRFLEKSWATYFAKEVFPYIDEEIFAVLYSANAASRPNTPVNVLVGAGILQELNGLTDDQLVTALMFDIRYQVALHTTSFDEQPLSDKSMQRFRRRCLEYEEQTGIDLIHKCIKSLSERLATMSGIDGTMKRIDSMMIASNIRKMSRLELLYTCVADVAKHIWKHAPRKLPKGMKHYTEADDRNRVIYHIEEKWQSKILPIIRDGSKLLERTPKDLRDEHYEHLVRAMREQTITDEKTGKLRLRTKADGYAKNLMQSPYDDEASYREKAGKEYKGYVGNIEESVSITEDGRVSASVITDYDLQPNTHSDVEFMRSTIENAEPQSKKTTIVADGGYADEDLREAASEKNIELVNTNLTGKDTNSFNAFITLSDDKKSIANCMAGQVPLSCSYNEKNEQIRATMDLTICQGCRWRNSCPVQLKKTKAVIVTTKKKVSRARQQVNNNLTPFKMLARIRNGAETVPSFLRRMFNVDTMPVRKLKRMKQRFGFKIGALNILKNMRWMERVKCAQIQENAA